MLLVGLVAKLLADLAAPAALQPDIGRSVLAHAGGTGAGLLIGAGCALASALAAKAGHRA